jgi:hypothetical protein
MPALPGLPPRRFDTWREWATNVRARRSSQGIFLTERKSGCYGENAEGIFLANFLEWSIL